MFLTSDECCAGGAEEATGVPVKTRTRESRFHACGLTAQTAFAAVRGCTSTLHLP